LVRAAGIGSEPLVVGPAFATRKFVQDLVNDGIQFVVALRPGTRLDVPGTPGERWDPNARVKDAVWSEVDVRAPDSVVAHIASDLGLASLGGVEPLRCFAVCSGGILEFRKGTLVGLWCGEAASLEHLARMIMWVRWIPLAERRTARADLRKTAVTGAPVPTAVQTILDLQTRANLKIAREQEAVQALQPTLPEDVPQFRGALTAERPLLNVVELFAGAGGLGLGFLLAGAQRDDRGYKLVYSGEVNPIYTQTLRINHCYLHERGVVQADHVPAVVEAVDHRRDESRTAARVAVEAAGGVDVLVGGPPCQGFSTSNRNSWSPDNPNNRLLETFIEYVVALRPRVLLMENVQGILWTPKPDDVTAELSVVHHVAQRLGDAGYHIYPKLLDAAWYGVPQFRNRFFLLGLHENLGYPQGAFGSWGPFPARTHGPGMAPYVTVDAAFRDLPPVGNGAKVDELPYIAPHEPSAYLQLMRRYAQDGTITDHVTSRHADYVIKRYHNIREGRNWQDIADMMTNYADIERTHSNIYRRLQRSDPSITIGHYRKSMLIHPQQDRGLSLREAARLQSFPDWFRFAGSATGVKGGLSHKQQQLANAVCPLLSEAIASFLLDL
jgi:DNA-cytosine methyltransferase